MFEKRIKVPNQSSGTYYLEKWFHGQWYQHGSQLLFQETAHPQGIYLLNECNDIKIDTIVRKCHFHDLGVDQDESAFKACHEMCFFSLSG